MRAESKLSGEISHYHGPKQTRWRRSLRGDAFEPTRRRRHVGAACQASQQFWTAGFLGRRAAASLAATTYCRRRPCRLDCSWTAGLLGRRLQHVSYDELARTRLLSSFCANASAVARENVKFLPKTWIPLATSEKSRKNVKRNQHFCKK